MRKVRIIRTTTYGDYYYDNQSILFPASGDWQDVDDKEYQEICMAVQYANRTNKGSDWFYLLAEYSDKITQDVYASATAFKEEMKRQKEAEEKKKAEAKAKRKITERERKKKQLQKLKKELGEE